MKINCVYNELVELHKLVPNPKNPNKHSLDQIDRLAKIIDYQGMRRPIIVSNRSGFITAGHGRLEAIKKLGWNKAPVDFQDYEDEAQEYADMVADNAISEWSGQDFSQINKDFLDLGPELDIELLGLRNFTIEPLDKVLEDVNKGDENSEWVGMPEFETGGDYIKLIFHFESEESRRDYVENNDINITMKKANQWIVHI